MVALLAPCAANAQAVRKGNLVSSLGGGAGLLDLHGSGAGIGQPELPCGAVRFAFAHAFGKRWSLGLHYDRIGSADHGDPLERLRITTYQLEAAWRPWIGERAALELLAGAGTSILALRPVGGRLPYGANAGVVQVGARWLHMVSGTLGAFVAADHAVSAAADLALEGETVNDADGKPISVSWSSSRITAGLLLRF